MSEQSAVAATGPSLSRRAHTALLVVAAALTCGRPIRQSAALSIGFVVLFQPGSAEIDGPGRDVIREFAGGFRRAGSGEFGSFFVRGGGTVTLDIMADDLLSEADTLNLCQMRGLAVITELERHGVPRGAIRLYIWGEARRDAPSLREVGPDASRVNRRVVLGYSLGQR